MNRSINNFNNKVFTHDRGFTIVELLIVIVVIGILAAIVIVAYNGIQNSANTTAAQSAASTVQKKAEAFNALNSYYPTSTTNTTSGFAASSTSTLSGTGVSLGTPSSSTGKTTVRYEYCVAGSTAPTTSSQPTGARITYYDFSAGSLPASASAQYKLGTANDSGTMSCTAAS